jgi:hypothetical protein
LVTYSPITEQHVEEGMAAKIEGSCNEVQPQIICLVMQDRRENRAYISKVESMSVRTKAARNLLFTFHHS